MTVEVLPAEYVPEIAIFTSLVAFPVGGETGSRRVGRAIQPVGW
jgi:hypothetical protein